MCSRDVVRHRVIDVGDTGVHYCGYGLAMVVRMIQTKGMTKFVQRDPVKVSQGLVVIRIQQTATIGIVWFCIVEINT